MIRELNIEEIPYIAQMETDTFSDGWSEKSLQESFEQEHVKMFVYEEQNRITGYVVFYGGMDEGDLVRIAVLPQGRRKGIGSALLCELWKYCKEQNIGRVLLEVRESNSPAIALYEKQGFTVIAERKNYYTEPLEHGIIMEKQIDITASNETLRTL